MQKYSPHGQSTTSCGSRDLAIRSGHDGRDGSGRGQIRGEVGRVDREMGWATALRSKL